MFKFLKKKTPKLDAHQKKMNPYQVIGVYTGSTGAITKPAIDFDFLSLYQQYFTPLINELAQDTKKILERNENAAKERLQKITDPLELTMRENIKNHHIDLFGGKPAKYFVIEVKVTYGSTMGITDSKKVSSFTKETL